MISKKTSYIVMIVLGSVIAAIVLFFILWSRTLPPPEPQEDKAQKIATWIQETVNVGGYHGCETRVIMSGDPGGVQVDLHWPAGTSTWTVIENTRGVADRFAQVGHLAATIYYAGYSGAQKVCEYEYDPYSGTVK